MRRERVEKVKEGDVVAINIYGVNGKDLLKKDTVIKDFQMEKLRLYHIPFIYIKDEETTVNYIYDMGLRAELLKVLACFCESEGENGEILKRYNVDEINSFLSYNNETGNKIAYGHIFRYFVNEMLKCLKNEKELYYDFIDYRNVETYFYFHMVNACCLSMLLGYKMGLSEKELIDLGVGGLLYDLKMQIYNFVHESKELDPLERDEMEQHTILSFDALRKIYGISAVSAGIGYQHHERVDGSGYPKKLKGDDISVMSRIVAVADVYDALISHRPFRPSYDSDTAWDYMLQNSGVLFDEKVISVFKRAVPKYWPGDTVLLNTDERAVIIKNNLNDMERPTVKLIEKKDKNDIISNWKMDLTAEKGITILKVINSVR